jgi:hypothetical protein
MLRHRHVARQILSDKLEPQVHGTALSPRHESVLPSIRDELLPI